MTGIIEIENMEFFAYHGCFEAEQTVGNKFTVYACLHYDCARPAETDCIADALSYQTAYEIIVLPVTVRVVRYIKRIDHTDVFDEGISYNILRIKEI